MPVQIPRNTFADVWDYFIIPGKPVSYPEMLEFWASLTPSEKHYYMCADLGVRSMPPFVEYCIDNGLEQWQIDRLLFPMGDDESPVVNRPVLRPVIGIKGLRPSLCIIDEWTW